MENQNSDKTTTIDEVVNKVTCEVTSQPLLPPVKGDDSPYVILMETNGGEEESWYYFIKYKNNKENLEFLQNQLERVEFYIIDDLSTFDLDLENFVSARTAKEMSKVDLNHTSFHRKFDGRLDKIDFKFKKKDSNEKKIAKCFDILGYGQIEDYITDEDIDEEDLVTDTEESSSDDSESSSSGSEVVNQQKSYKQRNKDNSSNKNTKGEKTTTTVSKKMPEVLKDLPKFARHKRRR